jgi:hypothetical protein
MKLFDAFKQYIVKHPKVAAYKPTSADYDRDKLFAIVKKLATDDMMVSKEETKKVLDFLWISDMAHRLYQDFYQVLNDLLPDFNMEGEDVVEYFIAFLNQEHKAAL